MFPRMVNFLPVGNRCRYAGPRDARKTLICTAHRQLWARFDIVSSLHFWLATRSVAVANSQLAGPITKLGQPLEVIISHRSTRFDQQNKLECGRVCVQNPRLTGSILFPEIRIWTRASTNQNIGCGYVAFEFDPCVISADRTGKPG